VLLPHHPVQRGCVLASLFVGLTACGSVNSETDAGSAMPDAARPLRSCTAPPTITNVEDAAPAYSNSCIHGAWTLQALNGTTTPNVFGMPNNLVAVAPVMIAAGSNMVNMTSTFAIHVAGGGQENAANAPAYAQLTAALNTLSDTDIGTVDASAYTGIQFSAMLSAGTTGARLTVGTLYTDPAGGKCDPAATGQTMCFDNPGAQLAVSGATWTKYQVPFTTLRQIGFGLPSPIGDSFPKNAITHIKWDIGIPPTGPTAAWDLWVDDVQFYQ
jgi:hypothetical protein